MSNAKIKISDVEGLEEALQDIRNQIAWIKQVLVGHEERIIDPTEALKALDRRLKRLEGGQSN